MKNKFVCGDGCVVYPPDSEFYGATIAICDTHNNIMEKVNSCPGTLGDFKGGEMKKLPDGFLVAFPELTENCWLLNHTWFNGKKDQTFPAYKCSDIETFCISKNILHEMIDDWMCHCGESGYDRTSKILYELKKEIDNVPQWLKERQE